MLEGNWKKHHLTHLIIGWQKCHLRVIEFHGPDMSRFIPIYPPKKKSLTLPRVWAWKMSEFPRKKTGCDSQGQADSADSWVDPLEMTNSVCH